MERQQRRTAFATRLNEALARSSLDGRSDADLVRRLAREGIAVSTQTVSNWRNGKYFPRIDQIEGIARMLDVEPGALAFGTTGVAEASAVWRNQSEEQKVANRFASLGDKEREAVSNLINVLASRKTSRRRSA